MEQKRSFFRLKKEFSLRIKKEQDIRAEEGYCLDISTHGIRLTSPLACAKNDVLQLEFQVPGSAKKISFKGVCRWQNATSNQKFPFVFGVEFINVDGENQKILERLIHQNTNLGFIQISFLILGIVLFLELLLRALNLLLLGSFSLQKLKEKTFLLNWDFFSIDIYLFLHLLLAVGLLLYSIGFLLSELASFKRLIFFYLAGSFLQLIRVVGKIHFISKGITTQTIFSIELFLLAIFIGGSFVLLHYRKFFYSTLKEFRNHLTPN